MTDDEFCKSFFSDSQTMPKSKSFVSIKAFFPVLMLVLGILMMIGSPFLDQAGGYINYLRFGSMSSVSVLTGCALIVGSIILVIIEESPIKI